KRVEPLLVVLAPAAVEALNGPAPEASEDKPYLPLGAPAGFQTIEPAVFSPAGPDRHSLVRTARATAGTIGSLPAVLPRVAISDTTLLEALRLEIARIATLGVAGFDVGPSGDAIVESAAALEGSRALVGAAAASAPRSSVGWSAVDTRLARA